MRTISGFLAATLLSLACITTQAAQTDQDATASAGPPTATATTKPATKAEKDEDAIPQALIDASRRSFVVVETHLKKDTSEPLIADENNYRVSQMYSEFVDQKRPDETPGIIIDTDGRVLIVDTGLDDRYIDRLAVNAGGKSFPAKRAKLLYDAPAVILHTDANVASVLKPLKFAPLADKGVNTILYRSVMYKMNDQWQLQFAAVRPSLALDPGADIDISFGNHMASTMSYGYGGGAMPFVIADSEGRPVGCATAPFFDLRQKECLWLGDDLRKAEGIEWGKLVAAEKTCREKLLGAVHEVVLVLRQGESDGMSRYRPSFMSSFSDDSGVSASGREISTYGLAVSDTDVVVLRSIDRKVARQIEKIYIKHSPTRRQEVQFVGAFKDIGGFCVRVTKGKLPAHAEFAGTNPQRMRPFWQARMRKRLGEKYVDLSTNRLYGKQRGYAGKYYWYAARSMPTGSFMVDFDGRIIGACAQERREDEEEQQLDASQRFGGSTKTSRVFTISELRDLLTKPTAHLDAKIVVTTKTLAKRHAWLGVESVPVTPDLAEMLKIETPTRDGKIGFLINAVYDESPAQKMKLQVGDILLKIQGPKTPYPIELASRYARDREYYGGRWYGRDDDDEGPLVPTWKNRENFITKALDAVGVGKVLRITYYHPTAQGTGKTETLDYKIELAPPDQESANKWKNRKLGLTVKDVTYEVRHALSLTPPAGVIVTNVESGSPTLIAKIFPNEVITQLDDKPLTSPRQMRDLIAKASKAGREKVRVTVLRLGKTRQADFDITEYDPADDEGLDED